MFCSIYVHFSLAKLKSPMISLMSFSNEYLLFLSRSTISLHDTGPKKKKKKEHNSLDFTMCDVCAEIAEGDDERRDFLLKLCVIWNIISAGLQFMNSFLFFQLLKQLLVTDWSTVDLQCLSCTVIQFYIYIFFMIRFFH